jgi:hypothetical protein
MNKTRRCRQLDGRRRLTGAATVELAFVLPLLLFLFVAGMDYARVFHASVIVAHAARNGALFASDANVMDRSPYGSLEEALASDASELRGPLVITTHEGIDLRGYKWVEVTARHTFHTVLNYPGIPSEVEIVRAVRMRKIPLIEEEP